MTIHICWGVEPSRKSEVDGNRKTDCRGGNSLENSISLPNEFMMIHFFQAKDFFQIMFNGQNYKIIGKDDVENFVGLSSDKQVFLLNTSDKSIIYISKDIEIFSMEIEMYHQYSKIPFPNNPTEEKLKEREKHFRESLMQIDRNAYHDENTYWSYIAEEMGYGII